jgi:hypothetical protein
MVGTKSLTEEYMKKLLFSLLILVASSAFAMTEPIDYDYLSYMADQPLPEQPSFSGPTSYELNQRELVGAAADAKVDEVKRLISQKRYDVSQLEAALRYISGYTNVPGSTVTTEHQEKIQEIKALLTEKILSQETQRRELRERIRQARLQ